VPKLASRLIALCLAVAGCGGGSHDSGDAAAGRHLFVKERCGGCHALHALGAKGASGPSFDTRTRLTRPQLLHQLTEGANGMPSYAGRLTPRQLDQLATFLLTLGR
jgi:mono/diheme cytochrome c family protein